jgi:hypothetical protein
VPERRRSQRDGSPERRSFPRPPLWLNLLLLALAMATFAWARHQRDIVLAKTQVLFAPSPMNPEELNRIRDELSQMDLTREQLARQLDGRMKLLESLNSSQFYIAIDTAKKKFYFRLGRDVVREADIAIGERKTITSRDKKKTWTFVPLKGSFNIVSKQSDYDWVVPEWFYAMRGEPVPADRPTIHNGLGAYVITLPDNYVIQSPPPDDSPLHGMVKPGSIMVPEADLAAIWPRITNDTRVYIF